jgi:hypothetical protein
MRVRRADIARAHGEWRALNTGRSSHRTARRKSRPAPSGHVGIYRADDGKRWEAYVMPGRTLVLLGVYTSKRAVVAARAKYWKGKDRATANGKRNG